MTHWELDKANGYGDDDSGWGIDWFSIISKYVVPGMLILAVIGVIMWSLSGSDLGTGNVFQDMGKAMFNFGAV
jgi:hypothetical protein